MKRMVPPDLIKYWGDGFEKSGLSCFGVDSYVSAMNRHSGIACLYQGFHTMGKSGMYD